MDRQKLVDMIELRNLTKRYGDTTAVDDLSFTVRPGLVTGFLGPNGAGKSTTMRMIVGLDRPTRGEALVDGKRYAGLDQPLRHVGVLLDPAAVHHGRRALDHLHWLAASNGIGQARATELIERVGLGGVRHKRIRALSLGMKQRLGVAAALLGDPHTLIFDEPVNGLDPEGVRWIRDLMRALAEEGRTVFVSSHLMSEMALTADHVVIVANGQLVKETPMETLTENGSLEDAYLELTSGRGL